MAPMGVLAPGSAHARPSAQSPIDTSAHVWEGGGDLNNFPINFLAISGDSKHFSFFSGINPKKTTPHGTGVPPIICLAPNLI